MNFLNTIFAVSVTHGIGSEYLTNNDLCYFEINHTTNEIFFYNYNGTLMMQNYIVQTPLFDLTFPENNIFGAPAGPSKAVGHAYVVFLQPLAPYLYLSFLCEHLDLIHLRSLFSCLLP
jgi:hypothetical protein